MKPCTIPIDLSLTDSLPDSFPPCYLADNHDDGETTCLCDLELGAAADFSTADGATDAMAAFKSIMGAPIDLSKALMMIIILLSILVFHTGWSVVGGAQDRCDEKAEADAALVATSAFDVDADLPVGQGAAAAQPAQRRFCAAEPLVFMRVRTKT